MRGVWIVACLIGAIGGTVLATFFAFLAYEARGNTSAIPNLISWTLTFGAVAIACTIGLFRSPAEIKLDMEEDEPVRPAPWIEEMRAQSQDQNRPD